MTTLGTEPIVDDFGLLSRLEALVTVFGQVPIGKLGAARGGAESLPGSNSSVTILKSGYVNG